MPETLYHYSIIRGSGPTMQFTDGTIIVKRVTREIMTKVRSLIAQVHHLELDEFAIISFTKIAEFPA